jgi:hypothetical protein
MTSSLPSSLFLRQTGWTVARGPAALPGLPLAMLAIGLWLVLTPARRWAGTLT